MSNDTKDSSFPLFFENNEETPKTPPTERKAGAKLVTREAARAAAVTHSSLPTRPEDIAAIIAERDRLRLEVEAGLARERVALAREMHLLELLQEAKEQQRQSQVLPPKPAQKLNKSLSPLWGRIRDYLRQNPGPQHPRTVQAALQLSQDPRYIMRRMFEKGLLKRPEPGRYVLAEDEAID